MLTFKEFNELTHITDIVISSDGFSGELHEGKNWISGRFDRNIRIDQASHGVGQKMLMCTAETEITNLSLSI